MSKTKFEDRTGRDCYGSCTSVMWGLRRNPCVIVPLTNELTNFWGDQWLVEFAGLRWHSLVLRLYLCNMKNQPVRESSTISNTRTLLSDLRWLWFPCPSMARCFHCQVISSYSCGNVLFCIMCTIVGTQVLYTIGALLRVVLFDGPPFFLIKVGNILLIRHSPCVLSWPTRFNYQVS